MCNYYIYSTNLIVTLPTGHIGYIEVPIKNKKPKYYQVNDITTLIYNVAHTYHPEIAELDLQTNSSLQHNDNTLPSHQFSLHQVYMTDSNTPIITSHIYNVQPTPYTSKPRIFPSLPYTIINKFNFNSLILQIQNILHFAICYSDTKHAMQHIKMMLARLQLRSVLNLNQTLNLLHKVVLKYQFIIELNQMLFLKK